ncbi:MAG: hypothetical protein WAM88_15055, partial [Nitrososphaeraceae archaeon]
FMIVTIVAALSVVMIGAPVMAQNMTGGNMTGGNMTGKISSDGLMQDNIQTPPANGLVEYERHDEGQDKGQGEDDEEEQEGGN